MTAAAIRALVAAGVSLSVVVLACASPRGSAPAAPSPGPAHDPDRGGAPYPPSAEGSYGAEPAAELLALERDAIRACAPRARSGQPPPQTSGALVLAARALAQRAADGDPSPLDPAHVRGALAGALSFDYAPVAHLVAGDPARAAGTLAQRVRPGDATHLGAGAALRGGRAFLVLLLARRSAALRPFPREIALGAVATLRGELVGLDAATVYATAPSGATGRVGEAGRGRRFEAELRFDVPGRWTVEVVGRGPRGPAVAALLVVACGGAPLATPAPLAERADPDDLAAAERGVLAAIDATRRARGMLPLEHSPVLREVARRHSAAMLAEGVLGHVVRGSGDLGGRLRAARVPYRVALENVAEGATALAAHRAAEESPAHLASILSPEVRRVGCGIARGRRSTGEPVVYLTEIFVEPVEDGADDRLTPEARVREALWRERARVGAPPLVSDAALDALAREAARDMARAGEPGAGATLGDRALALGRQVSAADAFVASAPADAVRSRNLRDTSMRRVGVGVTVGDSARYGAGRLWIAVVYTD